MEETQVIPVILQKITLMIPESTYLIEQLITLELLGS